MFRPLSSSRWNTLCMYTPIYAHIFIFILVECPPQVAYDTRPNRPPQRQRDGYHALWSQKFDRVVVVSLKRDGNNLYIQSWTKRRRFVFYDFSGTGTSRHSVDDFFFASAHSPERLVGRNSYYDSLPSGAHNPGHLLDSPFSTVDGRTGFYFCSRTPTETRVRHVRLQHKTPPVSMRCRNPKPSNAVPNPSDLDRFLCRPSSTCTAIYLNTCRSSRDACSIENLEPHVCSQQLLLHHDRTFNGKKWFTTSKLNEDN